MKNQFSSVKPSVWALRALCIAICWTASFLIGFQNRPTSLFAIAVNSGLFRSDDGGSTWQLVLAGGAIGAPATSSLAFDAANPPLLLMSRTSAGNVGGKKGGGLEIRNLYHSLDGGKTWSRTDLPTLDGLQLVIDPNRRNVIYLGAREGVFRSTDTGQTWALVATGGDRGGGPGSRGIALDPGQPGVVYATLAGHGIEKSSDFGATWTVMATGIGANYPGVTSLHAVAVDPKNSSTLYLGAQGSCQVNGVVQSCGLFRSATGGGTWDRIPVSGEIVNVVIDARNGMIYAAGRILANNSTNEPGRAVLHRSADGGRTWSTITVEPGPNANLEVNLDPGNANLLYARVIPATAATASPSYYTSSNQGSSWTKSTISATGLPANESLEILSALAISDASSGQAPAIAEGGVLNAASFKLAPVSPGSVVSIFGANLAPALAVAQSVPLPSSLSGTSVTVNGSPAPLYFVAPTQVNLQLPYDLASGPALVQVRTSAGTSAAQTIAIRGQAPAVYSLTQTGQGQGVVVFANTATLVAPAGTTADARPARPGEVITIYCNGLGAVSPPVPARLELLRPVAMRGRPIEPDSPAVCGPTADHHRRPHRTSHQHPVFRLNTPVPRALPNQSDRSRGHYAHPTRYGAAERITSRRIRAAGRTRGRRDDCGGPVESNFMNTQLRLALMTFSLLHVPLFAGQYNFTKVYIGTNSLDPTSTGTVLPEAMDLVINDTGAVAFTTFTHTLPSPAAPFIVTLYRSTGLGNLTKIADTTGKFKSIHVTSLNNNGVVAFVANLDNLRVGVYTATADGITTIFEDNLPLSYLDANPTVNDRGDVAFLSGTKVMLKVGNQLKTLADPGFGYTVRVGKINSKGVVPYTAGDFLGAGGVYTVSETSRTVIVEQKNLLSLPLPPVMNDSGTVIFFAQSRLPAPTQPGLPTAVYAGSGGPLRTILDNPDITPSFLGASINNAGTVVLKLTRILPFFSGYTTGPDPAADKIIVSGDPLFGSTVLGPGAGSFGANAINDRGQIAFGYAIASGEFGIMIANPIGGVAPAPTFGTAGIVNAASFVPGIVGNSWFSIQGSNLSSTTNTWEKGIVNGYLPTSLDGVSVTIAGKPAYLYYVSPTQINGVSPDVGDSLVSVTVNTAAGTSSTVATNAHSAGPAFFSWPLNQVVATRQDFTWAVKNGTFAGIGTAPTRPGEVIVLWGTGFGPTIPPTPVGVLIPSDKTYIAANPVSVTIGGLPAQVYGTALAPGFAGLYQVAIQIPPNTPDGDLPVIASIPGALATPATILIAVRR